MGMHSCCYRQKVSKGLWSSEEDEKLMTYVTKHGHVCWISVPKLTVPLHHMVSDCNQVTCRTDNEIKNLWNSSIKKKLRQKGMDPIRNPNSSSSGMISELN